MVLGLTMPAPSAHAKPTCGGRKATKVGNEGRDRIRGTPEPDVIVALGGPDVITGDDGGDRICGGTGVDRIDGEDGNDRLFGDEDGDYLTPGSGRDRVNGGSGDFVSCDVIGGSDLVLYDDSNRGIKASLVTGRAKGDGTDRITDVDSLYGTNKADRFEGNDGPNCLESSRGNDTAFGLGGDDGITTASGNDQLFGGSGDDVLDAGHGNDTMVGDDGDDFLHGAEEIDSADGGAHVMGDLCSAETEINCEF
jgi:Ca2+-binding RTX toxin-like protein